MVASAHLGCDDDLRALLPEAGWEGSFIAFRDPVCVGPVGDLDLMPYLAQRARVVALHADIPAEQARRELGQDYANLLALPRHERVLLWFEHDLWDQAALIRALAFLVRHEAALDRLHLMPCDGRTPFVRMEAASLAALVPQPLTRAQAEWAAEAWAAFAAATPLALDMLTRRPAGLPHAVPALRRHLMELPWTGDGLGLTERQILRLIASGADSPTAIFTALPAQEPLFHATDLIVAEVLRRLSEGPNRLVARGTPLKLSERGAAVLAGEVRHRSPPRFVGGVNVRPDPGWMWDPRLAGVRHA